MIRSFALLALLATAVGLAAQDLPLGVVSLDYFKAENEAKMSRIGKTRRRRRPPPARLRTLREKAYGKGRGRTPGDRPVAGSSGMTHFQRAVARQ